MSHHSVVISSRKTCFPNNGAQSLTQHHILGSRSHCNTLRKRASVCRFVELCMVINTKASLRHNKQHFNIFDHANLQPSISTRRERRRQSIRSFAARNLNIISQPQLYGVSISKSIPVEITVDFQGFLLIVTL